jgi:hypothetical protein
MYVHVRLDVRIFRAALCTLYMAGARPTTSTASPPRSRAFTPPAKPAQNAFVGWMKGLVAAKRKAQQLKPPIPDSLAGSPDVAQRSSAAPSQGRPAFADPAPNCVACAR